MNPEKTVNPMGIYILLILYQMTAVFELSMTLSMAPIIVNRLSILPDNFAYTTLGFVAFGLLTPFLGGMAQKSGLKPVLFVLNGLTLTGSLAVILTKSALLYTLSRALLGLSFMTLLAIIPSTIVIYTPQKRVGLLSGIFKLTFALGISLAPPAGIWLVGRFGFESIYMAIIIMTTLLGAANALLPALPLSKGSESSQTEKLLIKPPEKRGFSLLSVAALFIPAPIVLVTTYYSLHLAASGVPQQQIGLLYSILGMGSVGAGVFIILLSDRLGKVFSGLLGILFMLVSLSTLLSSAGFLLMVVVFLLYLGMDLFTGMFFPTVGLAFPGEGHSLLTKLTAYNSLGMVVLTLVAPLIYKMGFHLNVILGFLLVFMCGISYILGLKRARGYIFS
jgi:MFS family permease